MTDTRAIAMWWDLYGAYIECVFEWERAIAGWEWEKRHGRH